MKKLWVVVLCLALLAQFALAEGAGIDDHEHVYSGKQATVEQDTVYKVKDERNHVASTDVMIYPVCDVCGENGSGKPGDPIETTEPHELVDDKCVRCGYDRSESAEQPSDTQHAAGVPAGISKIDNTGTDKAVESAADDKADDDSGDAGATAALVYTPVDENALYNGVRVADHPEAIEALAAIGDALEGANADVSIPDLESLLNAGELQAFRKLGAKDRLMVLASVLSLAKDGLGDAAGSMSDDARALADAIAARADEAFKSQVEARFPKGTVTVDGAAKESFSFDAVVNRAGAQSHERYTFYNDEGAWKLCAIEVGK